MIFKKINDKFYNLFNLRLVATTKSFFLITPLESKQVITNIIHPIFCFKIWRIISMHYFDINLLYLN